MKAVQIHTYGGVNKLEIVDIEKPKPGKGQVLLQVYASSINPFDIVMREGYVQKMIPSLPVTLGSDVAGVVVKVGEGVDHLHVGEKVYGQAIVLAGGSGAFAEFAVTPVTSIAKMPENIGFNEAAAVVLTGVSAVQAICEHFNLQSGQKILIHGGAGGIGTIAIQMAKLIGAYVATTATGEGIDYVKKLGADMVIDYKSQEFDQLIFNYDAVFDTVGGQTYEKSFKVLKKDGIIVSMLAKPDKNVMEQYGVSAIAQATKVTTEHLDMLRNFITVENVTVHVDKVFPLDKIKKAFKAKETGDIKGKIAIEIK